jgi:hypothetical protein
MLNVKLDSDLGIATLEPVGELSVGDFKAAAALIDPYVDDNKILKGVVIHAERFPGWNSFAALLEHLSFVKEHHRKIERVAFVTDSALGAFGEKVAGHFVSAQVKHFGFSDFENAKLWAASLHKDGDLQA